MKQLFIFLEPVARAGHATIFGFARTRHRNRALETRRIQNFKASVYKQSCHTEYGHKTIINHMVTLSRQCCRVPSFAGHLALSYVRQLIVISGSHCVLQQSNGSQLGFVPFQLLALCFLIIGSKLCATGSFPLSINYCSNFLLALSPDINYHWFSDVYQLPIGLQEM